MLDRFLSQLDVFLQDNRVGSLRRAECSEVTYLTYLYMLKTEDIHPPKTGISVHFSGSLV